MLNKSQSTKNYQAKFNRGHLTVKKDQSLCPIVMLAIE